ncbi:MAG: hypothetical protein H7Y30_03690 [Pyrinomonadaceae bacterium]|nr:hypothetical protein [Pyrinomonadaceae bacterium]
MSENAIAPQIASTAPHERFDLLAASGSEVRKIGAGGGGAGRNSGGTTTAEWQ